MTLRLRNTILLLLAAVSAAGPVILGRELLTGGLILNLQTASSVIPVIVLSLFSTVACLIIFVSFRNTASSEIFFYYIFLFSVAFDIFRLAEPGIYGMAATRITYYGRFLGALALFSSGLFTTGLEYQRMGLSAVIIFALPAALVLILPVDVTVSVPGGTCEIGRFHEIATALAALELMAVLNFVIAGQRNESCDYRLIAAGILFTALGREMMFFFSDILIPAVGFILLLAGAIITGLKTHRLYLWD